MTTQLLCDRSYFISENRIPEIDYCIDLPEQTAKHLGAGSKIQAAQHDCNAYNGWRLARATRADAKAELNPLGLSGVCIWSVACDRFVQLV